MEQNFTTLAEATSALGEESSWMNANTAGSALPDGDYTLGKVNFEEYSIPNADGTKNEGQYPTIEAVGDKGHGTITGKQLLGQGIPADAEEATVVTKSKKESFYLKSTPFNPQFTGKPILSLLEMQGKAFKIKSGLIKVQTVFPKKGVKWTEADAKKAFKILAPKKVYIVGKQIIQAIAV